MYLGFLCAKCEVVTRAMLHTLYIHKRALHIRKRALYIHRRALHFHKRALRIYDSLLQSAKS